MQIGLVQSKNLWKVRRQRRIINGQTSSKKCFEIKKKLKKIDLKCVTDSITRQLYIQDVLRFTNKELRNLHRDRKFISYEKFHGSKLAFLKFFEFHWKKKNSIKRINYRINGCWYIFISLCQRHESNLSSFLDLHACPTHYNYFFNL